MNKRQFGSAVIGLVLVVALLGVPASASAATGGGGFVPIFGTIAVSVGPSATLTARLLAKVPVDIVCTTNELAPSTTPDNSFIEVDISQAAGRSVANGFGLAGPFACDGTTYHFLVSVLANGCCPSPPFHGGPAIVNVFADADWGPFDPDTGLPAGSAFGAAGPQVIRLH